MSCRVGPEPQEFLEANSAGRIQDSVLRGHLPPLPGGAKVDRCFHDYIPALRRGSMVLLDAGSAPCNRWSLLDTIWLGRAGLLRRIRVTHCLRDARVDQVRHLYPTSPRHEVGLRGYRAGLLGQPLES